MAKLGKKMNFEGPDTTKKSVPVKVNSKTFTPGKGVKGMEGPDLSGGGWVSGKKK